MKRANDISPAPSQSSSDPQTPLFGEQGLGEQCAGLVAGRSPAPLRLARNRLLHGHRDLYRESDRSADAQRGPPVDDLAPALPALGPLIAVERLAPAVNHLIRDHGTVRRLESRQFRSPSRHSEFPLEFLGGRNHRMEHVPSPLAVFERHQLGHASVGKHTYREPGWRVTFPAALPTRYRRTQAWRTSSSLRPCLSA